MKQKTIKLCIVSALYIVICLILAPISFGPFQLRLGEILCLLSIENPIYIISISIGCLISNLLLSPLGAIDAIVGTFASLLGCGLGYILRNKKINNFPLLSTIAISLVNAFIVSLEMNYILGNQTIFLYSLIEIFISEIIILVIIGYPIYNKLIKIERGN